MKKVVLTILLCLSTLCARAQWDLDMFSMRGRIALQDGKYAQAIEYFNVIDRIDTTDFWNYFYRGIAKYNLGDVRGAWRDFDRSVTINPVFTDGYHYRAIARSRFGEFDGALSDLARAIELRPGFVGLFFSRGVTYFLAQKFDSAIADFDKYILHEPTDPSAFLNRGACQLFLGDTTKALSDYNHAIKLDRYEPEGFIRRGRLYAAQEMYDEAISDLNEAISLDKDNTFAYFNRALLLNEVGRFQEAMEDLDHVLEEEPGNALTLYNRSLIRAQLGELNGALEDMDRVININPKNVLAYFNRASIFIEMKRWKDALYDYDKAIELYPDFAKAYQNRAYVENELGMKKKSKADYETARKKVREYNAASSNGTSFADTTRKYSSLIALDADFAKKDFNNELLQHRDVDIRLRPLYRFNLVKERPDRSVSMIKRNYQNELLNRFEDESPVPIELTNSEQDRKEHFASLAGYSFSRSEVIFAKGLTEFRDRQYNAALTCFNEAVRVSEDEQERNKFARYYRGFYLLNRAVLRADMTEFIASMQSNVQTLTMDDRGATRTRVNDTATSTYDYSEALSDMLDAAELLPDIPHIHFNLGNLYCLSEKLIEAIESYNKAISIDPYMGDAYFNRGLVLIYLKDKEKGCIDLSRAGELGVGDAYSVISKYCKEDEGD